jgi:hypothetical protein
MIPQVNPLPAVSAVTSVLTAMTGVVESVVVLFPSCPALLDPQHFAVPETLAQTWLWLGATPRIDALELKKLLATAAVL